MEGKLYIVGIGPGSYDLLTIRAERILRKVDEIVGYKTYIDLLRPYFTKKIFKAFGMGEELKRVKYATDSVLSGKKIALVSGGDPTIYGMVSPLIEYVVSNEIEIPFEVIPGVTSMLSASALLGAPLGNDFIVISLSDYLIAWETIVERLKMSLSSDMMVVLYNPVKRGIGEKIETLKRLIFDTRGKDTLLGIVKDAERKGESAKVIPAYRLDPKDLSMKSLIFISNKDIAYKNGYLLTPRGYRL